MERTNPWYMRPASVFSMCSDRIFRSFLAVSLLLNACTPSLDEPRYSAGTANFRSYVAVGGSFTAGFTAGALTRQGQLESFPALLAAKFALADGGPFRQPLVNPGNGFAYDRISQQYRGSLQLINRLNCRGAADLGLSTLPVNPLDFTYIGMNMPYNNMGVPGAKSYQLYSQTLGKGSSAGNPYYHRFATDTGIIGGLTSTVIGDALQNDPTFFTLWIGTNDVMDYALAGGAVQGDPERAITPLPVFQAAIDTIVENLTANQTQGVMANIPDLQDIPFFTTIPYNGLVLSQAQADSLNLLAPAGIAYAAGANPFVVYTGTTGGSIRQLRPGELVLRTVSVDDILCNKLGTSLNPIPSDRILDSAEVAEINTAVAAFNAKLRSTALQKNLAFADINALFRRLSAGILYNGVQYTTTYLSGGAFSVDGFHPNGRGYALIANEFIRVINARYNSNLPFCDVHASTGVLFP